MPHGRHIYVKASDTAKATICAYPHSYYAFTKLEMYIAMLLQCLSINIPDQETYDKHPNPSTSIRFPIYHLIAQCQQDTDSGQSTKIYTRKELVMMETIITNFHTIFLFQKSRSWSFTFLTYKYWVLITVVTLVEMCLNATNHLNMCYLTVIILRW